MARADGIERIFVTELFERPRESTKTAKFQLRSPCVGGCERACGGRRWTFGR